MTITKMNPAAASPTDTTPALPTPHAGSVVRVVVYLAKTTARFFRASRAAVVAFFGPVEVTMIDREGARVCHCAEGVHAKNESCAFDGSFV